MGRPVVGLGKSAVSLPDEKQVERALKYLEESEEAYAQSIAAREASELRLKQAREVALLGVVDFRTVDERRALASQSPAVTDSIDAVEKALVAAELLKAKRQRALLVIEVWRTLEASRRKGWA